MSRRQLDFKDLAEVRGLIALTGYRGKSKGDLAALADAIVALSRLADDSSVAEAEINPLMVQANNQSPAHDPQSKVQKPAGADPSVVAVDVRVLWREHGEGT